MSLDRIKARNAEDKAKGIVRVYKHSHKPKAIKTTVVSLPIIPCKFMGSPARPPEGKSTAREYYNCDAGLGVVCKCNCNSGCPKYVSDTNE